MQSPADGVLPAHGSEVPALSRDREGLGEWCLLSGGRVLRAEGLCPEPGTWSPPTPALQTDLQRLMSAEEEPCRSLAFSLALRSIQNNPR